MSSGSSMERAMADSQNLVARLEQKEAIIEALIKQAAVVNNKLGLMKTFSEDTTALNLRSVRPKHRSKLVADLFRENKLIKHLQAENGELRQCIDEYQSKVEMIMHKYREQSLRLIEADKFDRQAVLQKLAAYQRVVASQNDCISNSVAVMRQAALLDENNEQNTKQQLARLEQENSTLRELLGISNRYGRRILQRPVTADADSQTESWLLQPMVDRLVAERRSRSLDNLTSIGSQTNHSGPIGDGRPVSERLSSTQSLPDELQNRSTPPSSPLRGPASASAATSLPLNVLLNYTFPPCEHCRRCKCRRALSAGGAGLLSQLVNGPGPYLANGLDVGSDDESDVSLSSPPARSPPLETSDSEFSFRSNASSVIECGS